MGKKINMASWWLALWWTALATANLLEDANKIDTNIASPIVDVLNWVKDNAIEVLNSLNLLLPNWWEGLLAPWLMWLAWTIVWYGTSRWLTKITWVDSKFDDNLSWISGAVTWLGLSLGSVMTVWAWLTWLTFAWSRKVFEAMLPAEYVHLAKYLALAPTWFVASSTWLVDPSVSVLAPILAWTAMFWVNRFRA